jgi:osmotically-inducible protein OsmY
VQVTVEDGNVVLSGTVDTPDQAESLVGFAERTPGVVSVESRLS